MSGQPTKKRDQLSVLADTNLRPIPVKTVLLVGVDLQVEAIVRGVLPPGTWAMERAKDNASVAIRLLKKAFDVIVTNEKTSGSEDIELLRKIRRIRPHTRLIILTDASTPMDIITAMRERAFSFFSTPYSPDALAAMIRDAVEGPCWDDGIEVVSATPEWIRVLVRCERKTADRVVQFLDEIADLPSQERHAVGTAFREMLLNAIEHGGRFDPDKFVEIGYVRARHMVTCRITDPGDGFTLDEIPHAAIANPASDPIQHISYREAQGMRPGGFGVLLAQRLVDELIYSQAGNDVLLVKYLSHEDDVTEG